MFEEQKNRGCERRAATAPRILVVDDSECIRELLSLHFSNAGYEVLTAQDAIEGGRLLLQHRPELLIVDVMMPYMSGTEFVAAVRNDPQVADTPVIFLTSLEHLGEEAGRLRAVAHVTKPVTIDCLLRVAERYVPCSNGALRRSRRSRVVIVEDNPDAAESLRRLLDLCGYQVLVAYTAEQGLSTVRDARPDVVLCDIGLPDMDGFSLAERIRSDASIADVKMIAVTAYGSDDDRMRSIDLGFLTHLVKPVEPGVLLRHLESVR